MASNFTGKAGAVLLKCEQELRAVAVAALQEGAYDVARLIAELAESIADRRARAGLETAGKKPPASASAASRGDEPRSTRGAAARPTSGNGAYPRFARRGDRLVKIAWSRKNKQEYEHAAPWASVLALAGHVRARTRPGRIFSVEDLSPIPEVEGGGEMPGYQVYLALAWLREAGLVQKKGRNGYVADQSSLADDALARHWAAIPSANT